jgi:hypothetical protein
LFAQKVLAWVRMGKKRRVKFLNIQEIREKKIKPH